MRLAQPTTQSLYGRDGRRKYLTPTERAAFIRAAESHPRACVGTLCLVLVYCGCRLSEVLALRPCDVQLTEGLIAFRSLKKRGEIVVREVPIPPSLTSRLSTLVAQTPDAEDRIFSWSRSRAWHLVKSLMIDAGVAPGPHRTAKGLRHAFGIHAVRCGVPLNMVQRWLGHASLATTSIYTQAVGIEERELAERMW